ncbi:MAG: carboxymuconolactone decarboxylase family protein [Propylenella sp.]
MDQRAKPAPRVRPLPEGHTPELKELFAKAKQTHGFVPNSQLIMQRRPKIAAAFAALSAAIWAPDNLVDRGFKRLLAHVASRAAGCQYCMAHTAGGALRLGVEEERLAAIWEYETSPLFSPAEKAALDVAVSAAQVPNGVTDEMFAKLREHWSDDEIVEIVAVIALFGFLNRWNDTLATPLEDEPTEVGEKHLASHGWSVGKHG